MPTSQRRLLPSSSAQSLWQKSTSETSVNFYQTTRRNNPEDSHLYACHRENLNSQLLQLDFLTKANIFLLN
jgi:hypothetical protein